MVWVLYDSRFLGCVVNFTKPMYYPKDPKLVQEDRKRCLLPPQIRGECQNTEDRPLGVAIIFAPRWRRNLFGIRFSSMTKLRRGG